MRTDLQPRRRLIVGISGASGVIYGIRILQHLRTMDIESHLIMSNAAKITLAHETDLKVSEVEALASVVHKAENIAASISSGSFRTMGMIVAPCSIRSLSEIAHGVTSGLLSRAADVCLKERRRVVLMLRETPLHAGHIRSMLAASELGAIIAPPVPAFYSRPEKLDDIIDHSVGRVLDLFDLTLDSLHRWGENQQPSKSKGGGEGRQASAKPARRPGDDVQGADPGDARQR